MNCILPIECQMPLDHTKHPCYKLALEFGFTYNDYKVMQWSAHGFRSERNELSLTLFGRNGWATCRTELDSAGAVTGLDLETRIEGYGVKSLRTHLAELFPPKKPIQKVITREEILEVVGLEGPV